MMSGKLAILPDCQSGEKIPDFIGCKWWTVNSNLYLSIIYYCYKKVQIKVE